MKISEGQTYLKKEWDGEIMVVEVIEVDEYGNTTYQYADGLTYKEDAEHFKASLIEEGYLN